MKCFFECAFVSHCLYAVECDDGKQKLCDPKCSKCSFESVCSINKSKRKNKIGGK